MVLALVGVVAVLVCFLLLCFGIAAMERELVLNNWPLYRLQASRSCTHTVQRNYHYGQWKLDPPTTSLIMVLVDLTPY